MSSTFTIGLYLVTFGALVWLALRDRSQARQVIRVALRSLAGFLPLILLFVGLIGLLQGLLGPAFFARTLGPSAGAWAPVGAFLLGSVLYVAAMVTIPLAASLLRAGATVTTIAAFITGLVMVNTLTLPLEIKALGRKMAISRNLLSAGFALLIAWLMGWVIR